jgi:hypothetical protein
MSHPEAHMAVLTMKTNHDKKRSLKVPSAVVTSQDQCMFSLRGETYQSLSSLARVKGVSILLKEFKNARHDHK